MLRWICAAVFLLAACGPSTTPAHLNGRDSDGSLIDPINVWNDCASRTRVVAKGHDGDPIRVYARKGGVVEISLNGTRGCVSASFVKP